MLYLDEKEAKKFDFVNNNQNFVTAKYFERTKDLREDSGNSEKLEFLTDFLQTSYGVMTPKNLRDFFENCKM